jgi:peptidyl-tRNA hydrolase, PTH1 family
MEFLRRLRSNEEKKEPEISGTSFLIVGLGNPGRQYRDNRHNVGFAVVDRLGSHLDFSFSRVQFRSLVADVRHEGRRLLAAKPQTYMNESGQAVGALVRFFKIPVENLLVVYDDVDLPYGTLRLRPEGGSAGQKGVASIIERLGTKEFPRLRVGVGRPPGRMPAAAYVLQNFSKEEAELLPEILDRAVDASLTFVSEGLESAMNKFNGTVEL